MSDPLDGSSSQSNAPQPLSLVEAIALREQIARLECEKATLQAELDRCRSETEPLKTSDRTQQALLQAEQERVAQLTAVNKALQQRDRILEATAQATNALLKIAPLDTAIHTALQILGEALETDRVNLIENFALPSDSTFPGWQILHEWDAPGIVHQPSDPDAAQGSYEEIQEFYEQFQQGQPVSYRIEDAPEPFRSEQMAIGVKSTQIVPIQVEGQWWGLLGFDDCREAKERSAAELAVLKIAADCVGSAIQRDRTQQALLQAEQERAAELAKANEAMRRAVSRLAVEPNLDSFLGFLLYEIATQLNTDTAVITPYDPSTAQMWIAALFSNGKLTPLDPMTPALPRPDALFLNRLLNAEGFCVFDVEEDADLFWTGAVEFLRTRGKRKSVAFAIRLDDRFFGQISLAYETLPHFNLEQTALVQALSTQAALAIQLTRLAEEAKQAAIAREQEKAAQERATELARANDALRRGVERLVASGTLDAALDAFLLEALSVAEAASGAVMERGIGHEFIMRALAQDGELVKPFDPHSTEDLYRVRTARDSTGVMRRTAAGEIVVFPVDDNLEAWFPEAAAYHRSRGHQMIWHFPFQVGGDVVGYLGLAFRESRSPSEVLRETVQALAHQASLALETQRLAEQAKQAAIAREQEKAAQARADELAKANDALQRSLNQLSSDRSLESFLARVLQEAIQLLDGASAQLFLYDAQTHTISPSLGVDTQGVSHPEPGLVSKLPIAEPVPADITSAWQRMLTQRHPIFFPLDDPDHWPGAIEFHRSRGEKGSCCTALMLGDQPLGFLGLTFRDRTEFKESEFAFFQALAQQATLAIQLTRLAEEAKQAALAKLNEVIAREQEQAAQERAAELAVINEELKQRDRLLSIVAQITKDLLEVDEIDIAIPAALQAVGEVAEMSRVLLVIESQDPDTQTLHHHIVYEWVAEGIQPALGLVATNNATFHSLVEVLHQGQSWWGLVADLPDVTRLEFEALNILSTGVVPIFFEGVTLAALPLMIVSTSVSGVNKKLMYSRQPPKASEPPCTANSWSIA